ncbi:MAG TPA: serine hydrolase domain-containing protein [Gammaproteobacteria bacterium]|nr:serine hydrolase domain-containing protein [Gammaproteobacteria bacterium]
MIGLAARPRSRPRAPGILALLSAAAALPALAGSLPKARPEDVGMSGERLARIHDVVKEHIDAGEVAGVVTLVARRGKIVHFEAQGYADIASKTPMRTDNIFRLASMGKPVTAVAIMSLVEEGKIRLNDPVSRFIPEFAKLDKVAVPKPGGAEGEYELVAATRPITIRDLLTHGSGLMSGGLGQRSAGQSVQRAPGDTLAVYIPKLGAVALDFQPGTLWRYSGLAGFDVLSRVCEVVSRKPYDVFLKERIFTPLGMPDSGFSFTGRQAERVATIYTRRPGSNLEPNPQQQLDAVYFSGAGGLATSAEDYLQLAQMLLNGGELAGKRILGPRTVELMVANHTGDMVNGQFGRPAHGMGFGLGMQVVLDPIAADLAVSKGAFSWPGGSGVAFWVEPAEQLVSVYMVQGGAAAPLRAAFESAIRQAIVD